MAATDAAQAETTPKPSKLPMIVGVFLAVVGGGGGFYAAQSGLLPFGDSGPTGADHAEMDDAGHRETDGYEPVSSDYATGSPIGDIAFVPIDPLLISLGPGANARHLRFKAQIETPSKYASEVEMLMPRIIDVLNSYLRAVEEADIEKPSALVRLRAQMLRRVQIVCGPGRVNDLLIMEFVLN